MGKDTRHRKYQLTINNPGETWTHEKIKTALKTLNLKYYCMADETGQQEQTLHTHIYLVTNVSAIRFSTVKSLFPTAHIEPAQGTSEENRAYIQKSGNGRKGRRGKPQFPGHSRSGGSVRTNGQGNVQT